MLSHVSINVSDYEKSKKFYETALKPLGYKLNMEFGKAGGFDDGSDETDFWISQKDIKSYGHVAFSASSRKEVDDFYNAALAAGGKDNGKPGIRKDYSDNYYAAYVYDPDGNNIEAVCLEEE